MPRSRTVRDIKIGALCWNRYTTWSNLLEAGMRADRLGYDTRWTWGQTAPKHIGGRHDGLRRK